MIIDCDVLKADGTLKVERRRATTDWHDGVIHYYPEYRENEELEWVVGRAAPTIIETRRELLDHLDASAA